MQGAGYGALLGSIYGMVSPVIMLLLSIWTVTDFDHALTAACITSMYGFAVGGMLGLLYGFALGIISALVVITLTLIAQPSLTRSGLYRPVVRALCIGTVGLGLLLISIWIPELSYLTSSWIFSQGLPSLIAAFAFWRIGGSVATWVERNSWAVINREG